MGKVNQPSNLLDRVKRTEQQLQRLWKAVGLASATITKGGLTLLQDAFLRMVDDNGDEILYIGPDADGKQIFRLRREGGVTIMFTGGDEQWGRDFWALTDSTGRIIVSDDAETGLGLARPWLPVILYPLFDNVVPDNTAGYSTMSVASLTGPTVLWEGRASISHPWLTIDGIWGQATGSNTSSYRLLLGGVEAGSWSETTLVVGQRGRFDVSQWIGQDWVSVQLEATGSGTGEIACQVLGCYLI